MHSTTIELSERETGTARRLKEKERVRKGRATSLLLWFRLHSVRDWIEL